MEEKRRVKHSFFPTRDQTFLGARNLQFWRILGVIRFRWAPQMSKESCCQLMVRFFPLGSLGANFPEPPSCRDNLRPRQPICFQSIMRWPYIYLPATCLMDCGRLIAITVYAVRDRLLASKWLILHGIE